MDIIADASPAWQLGWITGSNTAVSTLPVLICVVLLPLLLVLAFITRKEVLTQGPPEYPFVRGFPWVLYYARESALSAILHGCQWFNWQTWTVRWPGHPRITFIIQPEILEHVLKIKFSNYVKGPWIHDMLVDLLGNGIFNADGDEWFTQRKVSVHMFSAREFKEHIMGVFQAHGHKLVRILDAAADAGTEVDMHGLYHRFTLDSIAEIAFGVSIGSLENPDVPFARAFDDAQTTVEHRAYIPGWQYMTWIMPREYRLRRSIRVMHEYCKQLITVRRAAGDFESRHDVLSRFMSMRDERGAYMFKDNDAYLRDVILNFLIAGRDTTAQALSWATFSLAQHPAVADAIQVETAALVQQASTDNEQPIEPVMLEYEQVARGLKYTQAVMSETLRLYPSVPKDLKQALRDDTLPDGTHVPSGSYVAYLPHAMGRNVNLWGADALEFKPDRFFASPEKPSPFKFIAFNAGPRACLGQHMAMVEASYVLAVICSRYTLTVPHLERVIPLDSLTLPMAHGMPARITRKLQASAAAAAV